MLGKHPFNSAWGMRRAKKGTPFGMARTTPRNPPNEYSMWESWFFGSDGIGFGTLKRWTGTMWLECKNLRVRWF